MLQVTDTAAAAIRRVLDSAGPDVSGLRIMVESGGCSGLQYKLGLEREAAETDMVVEQGGVKVIVDAASIPHLTGMRVDYQEKLEGAGFVFENPNVKEKCSCGKSFSC